MGVNSMVLYFSSGIKEWYSLFSLFIRCDSGIFCPKTSVCWCIIHCIIPNIAKMFKSTFTTLFHFGFIDVFAAESQLVRKFLVAAVSFTTETQHFRTPELLFEKTRLSLVMFLCLSQHMREKNCPAAAAVKLLVQSFDRSSSQSVFNSRRIQFYSHFFHGGNRRQKISVQIQLLELVYITKFSKKKVVVQFQHSKFCIMKKKGPDSDWFCVFNLCFSKLNFI